MYNNNDNQEQKNASITPQYWWPYHWFYCDACGHEWRMQYYEGKSPRPKCPNCGDTFWVTRMIKD